MRIGIDLFSFIPGKNFGVGPTNYAYGLVENLVKVNKEHTFILFTHSKNCDYFKGLKNCKIVVSRLGASKGINRILHEQVMLPYYSRREKLDVLHLTGNVMPFFISCETVLTVHDSMWRYYRNSNWIPLYKKIYYGLMCPVSYRLAKTIIVMSQYIKDELIRCYLLPADKIIVIRLSHCLRAAHIQPQEQQRLRHLLGRGYIFSVTTTWPHKNLITLMKACAILKQRVPGFNKRLIVAGQNWLINRDIDQFVKEHGWAKETFLSLGFVGEDVLNYLYQNAGVFVFPSLYEGFGIPPLEAMKVGVPVLVSRAASLPEVGGDACLYADPRSPEDFAQKIHKILTDENLRRSLIAKGQEHQSTFSWEKTSTQTLKLYEERLGKAQENKIDFSTMHPVGFKDAAAEVRDARRKKVLIIHNYYRYSGGEDQVVRSEIDLLKQYGYDVNTYFRSNKEFNLRPELIDFYSPLMKVAWARKTYADLNALIHREQPAIAHIHNPFFMMTPSAYQACYDNGVPVIQTLHNYRFLCTNGVLFCNGRVCERCLHGGPWPAITSRCLHGSYVGSIASVLILKAYREKQILQRMVSAFIAPSQFCKDIYVRHAGLEADKVYIKPHFIDDPGPSQQEKEYALYVGTIREYKGILVLLEAWKKMGNIPLKIAGEIPPESKWLKAHMPSNQNIEFLGSLSMQETLDTMKKAKCVIVPSICYETFARAIIEAYACGVAVIASDIGALRERVIDGQTGFLFRPGDAEDLRHKVTEFFRNEEMVKKLGQNARELYEKEYTASINYQLLLAVYNKILSKPLSGK